MKSRSAGRIAVPLAGGGPGGAEVTCWHSAWPECWPRECSPARASATGTYPGETLSLTQDASAVVGPAVNFEAVGQQTDVADYAGGFDLNVFAKDPSVDPTCAPSYPEEVNNSITDPSEQQVVIGDWQGSDESFDVPFKLVFAHSGQVLLCAYSDWITDTAASAQLLVDVTAPASPGSAPTPPAPPANPTAPASPATGTKAMAKPRNTSRPRLKRSGKFISCTTGDWSNSPRGFSYRWLIGGRGLAKAKKSRLAVSPSLRGHKVQCSVRATNTAGAGTAVSHPLTVH